MIRPIVKKPGSDETRHGRGFSLGELNAANISVHQAKMLHIPIDRRRRSVHEENINILKEYVKSPEEYLKRMSEKVKSTLKEEKVSIQETIAVEEEKVEEEAEEEAKRISVTELKGLSKRTIEKLTSAGIEYVDELIDLDPKVLAETTGISETTAKKVIKLAKEVVEQS
ncbi:MAG: ribosomal protein L13e [Candidatus Asgardarchaeia archaeon]